MTLGIYLQPLGIPRLFGLVEQAVDGIPGLSDADRAAMKATSGQSHTSRANLVEWRSLGAELEARTEPAALGDLPLIVLAQDGHGPEGLTGKELEVWHRLQRDLAARSTRGVLRVVPDSGHVIMWDQPRAVAEAVHELVQALRSAAVDE
jgi:pimeloyl-ACP methyl ester carboxylesterase